MKTTNKFQLTSMQMTALIFCSEFLVAFVCMFSSLLPLYAILGVGGFILSLLYYKD